MHITYKSKLKVWVFSCGAGLRNLFFFMVIGHALNPWTCCALMVSVSSLEVLATAETKFRTEVALIIKSK